MLRVGHVAFLLIMISRYWKAVKVASVWLDPYTVVGNVSLSTLSHLAYSWNIALRCTACKAEVSSHDVQDLALTSLGSR